MANCGLRVTLLDNEFERELLLRKAFHGNERVQVRHVERVLWLHPPAGFDALYLPLAAAERWGSLPLVHRSQILNVPETDQKDGTPPFVVTGTLLAKDDKRGPEPELRILLTAVFNAIREHNQKCPGIKSVAFWSELVTKGIRADQLRDLLYDVAPELRPELTG